jgi:hypothetical protein
MVIAFIVIIWSAISQTGYIFLKLSQDTAGEPDITLTP